MENELVSESLRSTWREGVAVAEDKKEDANEWGTSHGEYVRKKKRNFPTSIYGHPKKGGGRFVHLVSCWF